MSKQEACSSKSKSIIALDAASHSAWRSRVTTLQSSKMTPEVRQRVRERAVLQRRTIQARAKGRSIKRKTKAVRSAWSGGMRQQRMLSSRQSAPAAFAESASVFSRQMQVSALNAPNQLQVQQQDMLALAQQAHGHSDSSDEEDADEEKQVADLLQDLRVEPSNDQECAAKFKLYETFAETTAKVRNDLLEHWQECQADFEGSSRQAIQRSIERIDKHENLGIMDSQAWFVFSMASQSQSNVNQMQAIVREIDRKLAMLSAQDDCPICFDDFDAESPQRKAHVLSCCHKVCAECWEHWQLENQGHAYCPLCRNDEFLERVIPQN